MEISSCLNPQRVWNIYTKCFVFAPCGKCAACKKRCVLDWTQRLDQERYSWKYCVFFTLTYAPEHLPQLECDASGVYYADLSVKHVNPSLGAILINVPELLEKSDVFDKDKLWLSENRKFGYLSVYDAQCFIKRVRINISRGIDNFNKENGFKYETKDKVIRYYLTGEYGETFLRPHYHGLFFFSSEWTASNIQEVISKSWKFGIVDSSFVKKSNTYYVAGYVNSVSNLPSILLHKRIRPFSIFSKHPFIGSLCHSSQEVQKIFYSASPDHIIFNHSRNVFDNVPLWRSYKNRLFPKLSAYGEFSHTDRVALYSAYERIQRKFACDLTFDIFRSYVTGHTGRYVPSVYSDYVNYLSHGDDISMIDGRLYNWYAISQRVFCQSVSFGCDLKFYVNQIEKFYEAIEKRKIRKEMEFQEDYCVQYKSCELLSLDRETLQMFLNVDLSDLTEDEVLILRGFGVDIDKFYHDDILIRDSYRMSILPESLFSFQSYKLDCELWQSKNMKTKRKNEYLQQHPELLNILW